MALRPPGCIKELSNYAKLPSRSSLTLLAEFIYFGDQGTFFLAGFHGETTLRNWRPLMVNAIHPLTRLHVYGMALEFFKNSKESLYL